MPRLFAAAAEAVFELTAFAVPYVRALFEQWKWVPHEGRIRAVDSGAARSGSGSQRDPSSRGGLLLPNPSMQNLRLLFKIPVASASLRPPSPSPTLTSPSSPNSLATRRDYSPLAAFYAKPTPIINATPSSPPSTLATLPPGAANLLFNRLLVHFTPHLHSSHYRVQIHDTFHLTMDVIRSQDGEQVTRGEYQRTRDESDAGRISSVKGSTRAVSPVRNGCASVSGISRTKDDEKKDTAKGPMSYFSSTSLAASANGVANKHETSSSLTKHTLVSSTSLSIELKGTGLDDVEVDVPPPCVTMYAFSTPPSTFNSKDIIEAAKGNGNDTAEGDNPP
ncbi:hypothetical protein M422DRAFT_258943 [Sphaerobolus stellatus SS14]|uniref:Uncharacterized protein n=1 Tax=Sphaerobolus stellatus (strain SS14) TaxID=990650 RepID=A0A0C9VKM0_SPHS4|nr:hypothetical protein M422DRAFT_258943 [Sphaerobolus stellatus SS14]